MFKLFKGFSKASKETNHELCTDYSQLVNKINKFNFKDHSEHQLKIQIEDYITRFSIWLSEKNTNYSNISSTGEKKSYSFILRDLMQEDLFINDFLIENYAITKEICGRVLKLEPYDSQLLTGIALHFGKIVELPTGEGKTLAAVFPVILNALAGRGVHIFTFNDYLAKRDANWMKDIYEAWGLKVDYVQEWMDNIRRKVSYQADITYLTPKEAGFDYLRDTLVYSGEELVHRPLNFAIVDEADSILIDEARAPLVIAGNVNNENGKIDQHLLEIVQRLHIGVHYCTDENKRSVYLTEIGINTVENLLGCGNLYDNNLELLTSINNLLHAKTLLKKDIDYIVKDNKIEVVDEFTGRIADKRKWQNGLQMAIEAIEGADSTPISRILGKITLQNFISLYPKMSGMTATAKTSSDEFFQTYNHEVFVVEPHKKNVRIDYQDAVYTHKQAKYMAIIEEVASANKTARPVLIGTANIEESEMLAELLKNKNINCVVLNAKNDDEEAQIIARAGELGTVTVSTNMAGRGVDIKLGEEGMPAHRQRVIELGGLYVIGTNKNECVRIDNQLRGRAGRQGDTGASRFFVSLEDDILVKFGIEKVLPKKYIGFRQKEQINDNKLNDLINHIQRVVNGQNFDIRKTLGKYGYILEYQRRILSEKRTEILLGEVQSLLKLRKPDLFRILYDSYSKQRILEIERRVSLHCIDESWYDFLEYCEGISEGINLVSVSGKKPLDEYHKLVIEEFDILNQQLQEKILASLEKVDFSMEDKALLDKGQHTPASTWTYIINDNINIKRFSLFKF
ncbi:MAG: preprotein translocase subunit SecA [Ruminiclostridium sp.]